MTNHDFLSELDSNLHRRKYTRSKLTIYICILITNRIFKEGEINFKHDDSIFELEDAIRTLSKYYIGIYSNDESYNENQNLVCRRTYLQIG